MKLFSIVLLIVSSAYCALALDISPSRSTVPEKFVNPGGKRFSIFGGDPERVQRVNEVKIEDFKASITLTKPSTTLAEIQSSLDKNPNLELSFKIVNTSKRSYTLSFPDAQRYDFMIQSPSGETLYIWSEDKSFVKSIGNIFVNAGESVTFSPQPPIALAPFANKLAIGESKIIAILSNYPEVRAEAIWHINP